MADELSPIKREQVDDYLAMRATVDSIPGDMPTVSFQTSRLTARDARKALRGLSVAISSMGAIAGMAGSQSEDLNKVVACIALISGGIELTAAIESLLSVKTAAKVAEGVAQVAKWNLAAPVVAAAAIGAAATFSSYIIAKELMFDGDISTSEGLRDIESKLAGVI